jgi:hypothetical protein
MLAKIHNLCFTPNSIRMNKSKRERYEIHRKVWLENLKRKISLGRPRCRWKDSNKNYNL